MSDGNLFLLYTGVSDVFLEYFQYCDIKVNKKG